MKFIKELARDFFVLGGLPLYALVIIRGIIGEYYLIVYQLIIALALAYALNAILKNADIYVSRGFLLFVYTSFFYQELTYTIFAFAAWLALIGAALFLRKKGIIKGIATGMLSAALAYGVLIILT